VRERIGSAWQWYRGRGNLLQAGIALGVAFLIATPFVGGDESNVTTTTTEQAVVEVERQTDVSTRSTQGATKSTEEQTSTTNPPPTTTTERITSTTAIGDNPLVQKYASEMTELLESQAEAGQNAGAIMETWPYWSEGDQLRLAASLVTMRLNYETIQEIDPPEALRSVHPTFVNSFRLASEGTEHLTRGIDNVDPAAVDKGTAFFTDSAIEMGQANQMFREAVGLPAS